MLQSRFHPTGAWKPKGIPSHISLQTQQIVLYREEEKEALPVPLFLGIAFTCIHSLKENKSHVCKFIEEVHDISTERT